MNRPPAGGQCKRRSGKAARSPPGFQPAPKALLGVGRAAPRPPGAAAPLCALRRTGTPRDKYRRRRLPWGQNRPAAAPGRALGGLSGLGQGRGALACWGRYGPLSRFRALGTMALRWPRPGGTALAAGAAALASSIWAGDGVPAAPVSRRTGLGRTVALIRKTACVSYRIVVSYQFISVLILNTFVRYERANHGA